MRILLLIPVFYAGLLAQQDQTEEVLKEAIRLHQAGDVDAAISAYRKYLDARPNSPLALSNLGAAFSRAGRYQEAVEQYQRALKLQPENTAVEMNLGLAWYKAGQIQKAEAVFAADRKSVV